MAKRDVSYAILLLLCGCGRLHQTTGNVLQLERLTRGLQQVWPGIGYPLQMRVTVKGSAGHEYLHCQLFNRSGDILRLNQSSLPWITPGVFVITALNSVGQVVTNTGGLIAGPMNVPRPISLAPGQSIAGNVALKDVPPGVSIPRDQDLMIIWSYNSVEMFGGKTGFFESGVAFLRKRQ